MLLLLAVRKLCDPHRDLMRVDVLSRPIQGFPRPAIPIHLRDVRTSHRVRQSYVFNQHISDDTSRTSPSSSS